MVSVLNVYWKGELPLVFLGFLTHTVSGGPEKHGCQPHATTVRELGTNQAPPAVS